MRISISSSLFAQRQLGLTTKAIARSIQRLSTGSEVNSAKDDAARLSISNKLEAQTRGLLQANRNVNDAKGMLVTAESAIDSQINIVIRMRELAVQAANGTLTSSDRTNINQELAQLFDEYKRITVTTEFGGQKLLDGSMGQRSLQVGAVDDNNVGRVRFEISDLSAGNVFTKTVGTGQFTQTNTLSMGSAWDEKVADINNDGNVDIVSVAAGSAYASVRLGNGDGTFQNYKTFEMPSSALYLRLGDFNNDGKLDFATSGSIQLGNGDGTFQTAKTFTSSAISYGNFELADVNRDGKLDFVQQDDDAGTISTYLGKGDGTFQDAIKTSTDYAGGLYMPGLKIADMDNDGILDLVSASYNTAKVTIYKGSGNGNFTVTNSFSGGTLPSDLAVADFNNDGKMDVLTTRGNGIPGLYVFLQGASGSFTQSATFTDGNSVSAYPSVADINNDGNQDIMFHNGINLAVFLGNGNGTFTPGGSRTTGSSAPTNLVDLNKDGVLDLVTRSGFINVGVWMAKTVTASAVSNVDVSTQTKAQNLISILDTTLSTLKAEQAKIGGIHDRLDMTASANLILSDNLAEAKSMMTDTDFALETAELVRNQILQQAQTAVFAQANLSMQLVLNLLKFND